MNESRVAVIIAEGGTEKTFLSSLLETNYGFESLTGKGSICFTNPTDAQQIWFFPVPSLGKTHAGGMGMLGKKDPYIKADTVLGSHLHMLSKRPGVHYFILTDTDGMPPEALEAREAEITSIITELGIGYDSFEVHFPNREIEVWLMAGLTADFPYFLRGGWEKLSSVRDSLEQIENPKEFLDEILELNLAGIRMAIGDRIGAHFNVDEAVKRSASFNRFMTSLRDKNLI